MTYFFKNVFEVRIDLLPSTNLYKIVKYTPSTIVVKEGKIYAYTDSNKDEYLPLDKSKSKTAEWVKKYVVIKKEFVYDMNPVSWTNRNEVFIWQN